MGDIPKTEKGSLGNLLDAYLAFGEGGSRDLVEEELKALHYRTQALRAPSRAGGLDIEYLVWPLSDQALSDSKPLRADNIWLNRGEVLLFEVESRHLQVPPGVLLKVAEVHQGTVIDEWSAQTGVPELAEELAA